MGFNFARNPNAEETALLKASAHANEATALPARRELAKALTLPLRQGVIKGDIHSGIFEEDVLQPGIRPEYPLDFLAPGLEKDHFAYVIPNVGRVPERTVESDYLMVPTYRVGSSIDCNLRYLQEGRWNIMGRMMQVLEGSFTLKHNRDAWHVLLTAGAGRNLVVYDDQASAGLFTKRLMALMQDSMARNAGGNTTSVNRGKLTDLWISIESHSDVLSWDLTQIPDAIRTQIYMNWDEKGIAKIGPVALHDLIELGVGQEFELYYENTLAGTLPGSKTEIAVGLDLYNKDAFLRPVESELEVFEDFTMHRQGRFGMYAWMANGWASLDSRRILLGAI